MKIFLSLLIIALSLVSHSQKVLSADEILQQAYAKAAKEKKNVMVIFHASWCGWCRKMDASLNDASVKDYFDKNYVIEHLVVYESPDKKNLENPGAEELNKKWNGEKQGLPFWVVLDKEGNLLADSQKAPGENVGCPATKEEVEHFIKVLKKTSTITDEQAVDVEKRFRKNDH